MGRHRYPSAHWQDVTYTLHKLTHWERKSSFISLPETHKGNQHIATSLLAVAILLWIIRRANKQNLKSSRSSHPLLSSIKVASDICEPICFSLFFAIFLLSLISFETARCSSRVQNWEEHNSELTALPPQFVWHLFQLGKDCHMGSLEFLSLCTLSCSGINLILILILLCGDVEVNPGPTGKKLNVLNVMEIIIPVAHKWKEFGIYLGIPYYKLDFIQASMREPRKCLMEVIQYWLNNEVNASWEKIIESLKEMGYVNLSHKIALQGQGKKEALSEIVEAMGSNKEINRKTAHIMVVGLPAVGKSSLIHNLLGRSKKPVGSTDVVEESHVIVNVGTEEPTHNVAFLDDTTLYYSWTDIEYKKYLIRLLNEEATEVSKIVENPKPNDNTHIESNGNTASKVSEGSNIAENITELLDGIGFETLKKSSSIYMWDTGGQIEFQEILSLLLSNPSIVIFVLNTSSPLTKNVTVDYRKGGKKINKYKSITPQEGLLQTLASIDAMKNNKDDKNVPDCQVFIVGTHIDCIKGDSKAKQKKINKMNKDLHDILRKYKFDSLVKYKSECDKTVMYTINNKIVDANIHDKTVMSTINNKIVDANIHNLRIKISEILMKPKLESTYSVKYRIKDLLFCLNLSQAKQKAVLSYTEFVAMAKEFEIQGKDEIDELLNFLHQKVGVIRYYSVEGDKYIICRPTILFSILTDLIVETFIDSDLYTSKDRRYLKEKGVISAKTLKEILHNQKELKLKEFTAEKFLRLLKFLNIVVSYEDENNEEVYFVPTALNHAAEDNDSAHCDESLAIAFQCKYCPKGLFIMLVAQLMNQKDSRDTASIMFNLKPESLSRNKVTFTTKCSGRDSECQVSIKGYLSHIEIKMNFMNSQIPESEEALMCTTVREKVMVSIKQSIILCNYNSERIAPFPGYKCQECEQFCKINPTKDKVLCEPCGKYIDLPSGTMKFFSKDRKYIRNIVFGCAGFVAVIVIILIYSFIPTYSPTTSTPVKPHSEPLQNKYEDNSANPWFISKNSTNVLIEDLQGIGSWELLCRRLGVDEGIINSLRFSQDHDLIKKDNCLIAYVDSGDARWDHVVKVVCGPTFKNKLLGKEIAEKHNVPFEICRTADKSDL